MWYNVCGCGIMCMHVCGCGIMCVHVVYIMYMHVFAQFAYLSDSTKL